MDGKPPEAEAQEHKIFCLHNLVPRLQQYLHLRLHPTQLLVRRTDQRIKWKGLFFQRAGLCVLATITFFLLTEKTPHPWPSQRTVVNQCQLSVVIPTQTLVQPVTSSSQGASGQTQPLLGIQGPGELQDFSWLNPDCKGESSCWDVGAWTTDKSSVEESFIYHSYDNTSAVFRFCCPLKI